MVLAQPAQNPRGRGRIMTQPEFSEVYGEIVRDVPEQPSAEDLHYFRYRAVDALRAAIHRDISTPDHGLLDLDACNCIGDYTMARMRWLEIYGPSRNRRNR